MKIYYVGKFTLQAGAAGIGIGAWLGTIMLFNVWVLIWPNQQKILGMVDATADEIAKALERDNFMTADDAKKFGLIDSVVEKRK